MFAKSLRRFRLIPKVAFKCRPLSSSSSEKSSFEQLAKDISHAMIRERTLTVFNRTMQFQLTNLAGHGSFIMLALGYLESDFLHLRVFAFTGISLSILFQYYREKPLWIPIRWNSLFLLINAVMIYLLLNEEDSLSNLPEEMQLLYQNVFSKRGMKPLEFRYLMAIVRRQELRKGDRIATENKPIESLFVVSSGELIAMRHNEIVAKITENQFIGEMSFLKLEEAKEIKRLQNPNQSSVMKNVDASAPSNNVVLLSSADVLCSKDTVLFSWSFSSLQRLFLVRPGLEMVFGRCISMDLSDKLRNNITEEAAVKYKNILVDILSHQEITDQSRALLKELRTKFNISEAIHQSIVNELGWSLDEYETGYKGTTNVLMLKYEGLLASYLQDNTISDDDKQLLLSYRQDNHIPYKLHLQCLLTNQWTPDEYERGYKNEKHVES